MNKSKRTIIAYVLIITIVLIFIYFKVGLTYNLVKIMPKFDAAIYSVANLYEYDIGTLKKARKQLDRQIDRVRNDIYDSNSYTEKGMREILYINEETFDKYIASYSEALRQEYLDLKNTDYADYIKNKEYNYDNKNRMNDLYVILDIGNIEDKGLYYEVSANFYKPIKIPKKDIYDLKENDDYEIMMPVATTSEIKNYKQKMKLTYKGNKTFSYKYKGLVLSNDNKELKEEELEQEIKLKSLNKEYYALYETDTERIDEYDDTKKICILKSANISNSYGPNFLYLANVNILEKERGYDISSIMSFEDYVNSVYNSESENEDTALKIFNNIYMNYIRYDKKFYVTDLCYFPD